MSLVSIILAPACRKPAEPDPASMEPVRLFVGGAPDTAGLCNARSRIQASAAGDDAVSKVEVGGLGARHIVVDLDAERLSTIGIGVTDVLEALVSSLGLDGEKVGRQGNEITIVIDACEEVPFEIEELMTVQAKDRSGNAVPLSALANVRLESADGPPGPGGPVLEVVVHPATPARPEDLAQRVRGWLEGSDLSVDVADAAAGS